MTKQRLAAVTLALALAACGGSSSDTPANDRSNFIGLWQVNGTTTYSFTGFASNTEPDSGNSGIIAGSASGNQIIFPFNQCNIPATVNGNVATIQSGFTCRQNYTDGTADLTFTSGTLVRSGNIITLTASGNATVILSATGRATTGTFVSADSLTKVGG